MAERVFWSSYRQRTTSIAIAILQSLAHKTEVDVFIDQAQLRVLWNLIFQSEVIKQRFTAGVLFIMRISPPTMAIHSSMFKLCCQIPRFAKTF
jgi:hypothetical protein